MSENPPKLTAYFHQDDDGITAWLAEFPEVITQGDTMEEAQDNLKDALQTILDYRRKQADRNKPAHTSTLDLQFS